MSNREILYIEDNFHNRRIVRKILERQGYTLHECEDGLEGYEFLKELKPGIVLLDISLPSMDGMEIARRVKEDPKVQHIYLIALTASAMQGDRERFLEAGCDDYLSKPFRALDLVDMVNKYADLVEANVPAPPPQPSELHDTGPLEREQKRTSVLPTAPGSEQRSEPTVETSSEEEAVPTPEIARTDEAKIESESEETFAVPTTSEEITQSADVEQELSLDAVEEVEAKHEADTPTDTEMACKVEEPLAGANGKVEVEATAEVVEAAFEQEEVEPEAAVEEEIPAEENLTDAETAAAKDLEPAAEDEAKVEAEPEEPETAWKLEKDAVDLQQVESELQDLPDAVDPVELDETSVEIEAEQDPPAVCDAADLPKKNGKHASKKTKSTEEIDAIKAGIMGVINPDNLKPVDPNNHRE